MPDQISASEQVGADLPGDQPFTWSPTVVENDTGGEPAAGAPERDLDLAAQELAEADAEADDAASPEPPNEQTVVPSSERGADLEGEHWRERAIVWRERAMAAELVAKMLQRNLDDLRANLEDLRTKFEAADRERTKAIASSETPWRRFARDMYAKYLG